MFNEVGLLPCGFTVRQLLPLNSDELLRYSLDTPAIQILQKTEGDVPALVVNRLPLSLVVKHETDCELWLQVVVEDDRLHCLFFPAPDKSHSSFSHLFLANKG